MKKKLLKKATLLLFIGVLCSSPLMAQFTGGGGSGIDLDPFQISTAAHLQSLVADTSVWNDSLFYKIMNDIDFEGAELMCIGYKDSLGTETVFTGNIDGNEKVISNLVVTAHPDQTSQNSLANGWGNPLVFIGKAVNTVIYDLGFVNYTLIDSSYERVGGFIGRAEGSSSITNCMIYGGTISANGRIGALVGLAVGCVIENCVADISVDGGWDTGGLVGGLGPWWAVTDVNSLSNCAFYGEIVDATEVVLGKIDSTSTTPLPLVENLYFSIAVKDTTDAYSEMLDLDELLEEDSYVDWDFGTIFEINDDRGYAVLKSFAGWFDDPVVSVETNIAASDISVYINADQLMIRTENQLASLEIYNITGQMVLSRNLDGNSVNVGSLNSGIYIAVIRDISGAVSSHKFAK